MSKDNRFQNILLILLAVAVVGMSVGFAVWSDQILTINGNATFEKAKWEVIYQNGTLNETNETNCNGTVEIDNSNRRIDYTVTMKPNSKYSFEVNAINNGTFDANLKSITFTNNSPAAVKNNATYGNKIGYTFKYAGQTYEENTTGLSIRLNAGETAKIEVELEYPLPESEANLLADDLNLILGVQMNYEPITE